MAIAREDQGLHNTETVRPFFHAFFSMTLLLSASMALAMEESVRRNVQDAGVHIPVLTRNPELKHSVSAVYPKEALAQGKAATVRLLITIDDQGFVSEAQIPAPVGDGFDEAAKDAVMQFVFSPAEIDGKPASVIVEYLYHFEMKPTVQPVAMAPKPTGVIAGQILVLGKRNRVEGATVSCRNHKELGEVTSDSEGRFELTAPVGKCDIFVIASSFELLKAEVTVEENKRVEVLYRLKPLAAGFETVVRSQKEKKEVAKRTLERQELQKIPGSFGDPVRVLQNFPGVGRAPYVSGALIVRGAAPSQTLTFLDGVEIPLLFHLGGGPSVVNGEFLDTIEFYPGGFGARYGRAVGGVVDVSTRKGATDTWHGAAKVDLIDSSLFLETPIGKDMSLSVAGRRSYIDAIIPFVLPKEPEGGTLFILPAYADYQLRFDKGRKNGGDLEKGHSTFYVMAFGSDDILKVIATGGGRNRDVSLDVRSQFHRLVGNWTHKTSSSRMSVTPYVGFDVGTASFGETSQALRKTAYGIRQDLGVDLASWLTLRSGVDLKIEQVGFSAEIPAIAGTQYVSFPGADPKKENEKFKRDAWAFDGALYLETDFKWGRWTLTPGVRSSSANIYNQNRSAIEPRVWSRFRLTDMLAIKGSTGWYTQPPNVQSMEPPPFGNPNLQYERAIQSSVGLEQRFSEIVTLDVTGYYNNRYDNIGSPGPTVVNADGSLTRYAFDNNFEGRAYGLEVMLRHNVTKHFFGWVAYTLNRSEEKGKNDELYVVTAQDQTHILTAVGSLTLPYGFQLGARFRYVTGRPVTPLAHRYDAYNVDSNSFSATRGEFRSSRLRDFNQLDLRIDKDWVFKQWTLTTFLDVQNVYNASNIETTITDYRSRESLEVPGIPILPVLGVRGSF